ncbi:hypothetical protein OS965_38840 [Streptomyces sp. H27-G5]|uniref:hypothetical protein n=1 Tax=Streptomyces sp. H27-G5 TaxID=2996698 RepID=UPI00226E355A|nr:hypothetical protein [Streptomyces sp. H27-G5]MCY0924015.1 hypothetical protein [Streptomyces sp. H27-G5]
MGWIHQDDETTHEGFVIAALPDGIDAPQDSWEDTEKADGAWAWSLKYDGVDGRPRATGIKAICLCGWRGPRQPADPADPGPAEEALRRLWFHHVEVSLARVLPPHVQKLLDNLEEAVLGLTAPPATPDQLDEHRPLAALHAASILRGYAEQWQETAVRAARTDYSWEEIARPLGVSKQSAHERFRGLN